MNKLLVLIISFLICFHAYSQEVNPENYIDVVGSAKMQIEPDEIYLLIKLSEYKKDKVLIKIEEIEKNLLSVLKEFDIKENNIKVIESFTEKYKIKRTRQGFYTEKKYSLKMTDFNKINLLINALEKVNIKSVELFKSHHSEITTLRKEVKIQAIKNAKTKAAYLLEALGCKVGKVMIVEEMSENRLTSQEYYSNSELPANIYEAKDGSISVDNIELRFEIKVRFEIIN